MNSEAGDRPGRLDGDGADPARGDDGGTAHGGGIVRSDRGQAVVGIALLFGMVAVASVLVLVAGVQVTDDAEQRGETERVLTGFRALDEDVDSVAYGEDAVRSTDLDLPSDAGGAARTVDTGRIVVTRGVSDGTHEVLNVTPGTVVYDREGTTVGYQAGGVWRGTGRNARMVSAPAVGFREGTMTFRIPDLEGYDTLASDSLTFRGGRTVTPLPSATAADEDLVVVRVTSRFYGGWADYFRQRFPGAAVGVDHARNTVVVRFGDAKGIGDFRPGLIADGGGVSVDNGASSVYTRILANGSVAGGPAASIECPSGTGSDCYSDHEVVERSELDWAISQRVELAREGAAPAGVDTCSGTKTLTAGTYFSEGFGLEDCTLVLDLSAGNVTLVVDGNVGLENTEIRVENGDVNATCCFARVYTTGDWAMAQGNAGVTVDSGNATRFQLYGTSEMHFAMGQAGSGFTGAVYAARDDPAEGSNRAVEEYDLDSATSACTGGAGAPDMCIGQGNGVFEGAMIGGPAEIQQASSFEYAPELAHIRPTVAFGDGSGPDLVYFHLVVHEVTVEDED